MRAAWLAVLVALVAAPLPAQVVRGRVHEVNSTMPVAGALVSLLPESTDSSLVNTLSSPDGEYAIRALAAGRYRLAVKRIGVRRFVSEPFALADGEARVMDVRIDAVALALPEVEVSGLCVPNPRELRRIASLWDEARTALEATEVSLRERLMEARISRYAAELDPGNLRTLFDWRSDAAVMVNEPFTSLSGDSLSAVGYWRVLPGDSVEFLAPDASALTSNAFLRDHCFTLAGALRGRPDLVGLAFEPARDRALPDIAGTIWLDARRFELRFIEFRYTRLPEMPNANRVGGEVHFARLESGAWIVERWFIRMPQAIVVPEQIVPRRQLREEGGTVITSGVVPSGPPASVVGVFRDSAGRPVAGAVIRAIGTHQQFVTRADGIFNLDSLPPGEVSIVAHTIGYDSYAVLAASRRVDLPAGRVQRLDLRAPSGRTMRADACPAPPDVAYIRRPAGRGMLRLLMVDSATVTPMSGVRFLVTWSAAAEVGGAPASQERYRQTVTDTRGAATFCDLPAGIPLEVSLIAGIGLHAHVMMVEVSRTGFTGRVVMGRFNR